MPLYDPGRQVWADHFEWDGYRLVGRTPVGRTAVAAVQLNAPRRLRIRKAEELYRLFPPDK